VDPIALQAAFRVAVLILVAALVMLPFQQANSAEFVVTVLAAVVGLIFPPNPRPVDTVSGIDSNTRNEEPRRGK